MGAAVIDDPRDYFTNARPEMRPFLPVRRGRVLEIGCGEGRFAAGIAGAEEVWGVDPDLASVVVAQTRMHRVLAGRYDEVAGALPDGYFDVVICNDVIEHMPDHQAFLADIRRKIAPGGALVGSVPNVRYFKNIFDLVLLRDWHYRIDGILDSTHLRFFTARSLERSLREGGYRVEMLHTINSQLGNVAGLRDLVYSLFGVAVIALSLGHARDIRGMQIAFRAVPSEG